MDEQELLVAFLGEHWALFQNFCEERGEDANMIYQSLGGEPE